MIKVGSKHLREMGFQVEKFLGARAAAAAVGGVTACPPRAAKGV